MSDKSPRHTLAKKSTKSIKEKRRDKREAEAGTSALDKLAPPKKPDKR